MKQETFYSTKPKRYFEGLAAAMMAGSIIFRLIWMPGNGSGLGLIFTLFCVIIPIFASLLIAIRLPIRGEKHFYVTVRPVIFITVYFVCRLYFAMKLGGLGVAKGLILIILCIVPCVLYYLTFSGRMKEPMIVLLAYLFVALMLLIYMNRVRVGLRGRGGMLLLSDLFMIAGIVFTILSARKLPPEKEGEPYRFRYGDRLDGRLIRGGIPLDKVSPYIMVNRNGATNLLADKIEISAIERYVHAKRKEGLTHFGITHILIAAFVRMSADYPGVMRFLSGQKVYQRMFLRIKMVVKKEIKLGSPETIISVDLTPDMTADQVYEKFNEQVELAHASDELDSGFDKLAGVLNFIPGVVLKFVVWLLKALDYFGLIPIELLNLSPFHGSLFVTSMGSLGIPPIFHHLYDFGNIPIFMAFGAKRSENELASDGSVVKKKYVDYNIVTDERIVDGQYYAACLKRIRGILMHPEQLDNPPETVKEDIY